MKQKGGNYNQEEVYQMLQKVTPEEQQRFLYQQQLAQLQYQEQLRSENESYKVNPSQQIHQEYSYRSGTEYEQNPNYNSQSIIKQSQNNALLAYNNQHEDEEDKFEYSTSPSVFASKIGRDDNFKVIIRVRPPLPREQHDHVPFRSCLYISPDSKSVSLMEYMGAEVDEAERQIDIQENPHLCVWHNFTFDYVYDPASSQDFLYDNTAKPAVESVLEGYNATMLAYGQTGTGKTYTMEGFKYSGCDPQRGIVPRSMEQIFKSIEAVSNRNSTFMIRASYLQIYNEIISDLLKTDRTSLSIREDKKKGIFVEGLSEWAVRSPNEIYSLMQKGAMSRKTAWTNKNDVSSRSHAVFIIIVEQMKTVDGSKQVKVGKLNLVDLAGSESVRITGATGERLEESKKINQSLSCLGNVIAALTDVKPRSHIPYRDSKLTRLLKDSLGGNCKTTMLMMVSPAPEAFSETASTLKFGMRAKRIKNDARINEYVDQRALLRKYEIELRKLKMELERRNRGPSDPHQMTKLEEEKRRAEEDKEAAINALELKSREYMLEREQKMRLEEKIKLMNSQMLAGGKKIEETPQFRVALEKYHKQIRDFYYEKLKEIEKESSQVEEKAQVDRYKQLLIKQRDIMIALTNRLNERDETIIQLQEELDAYDKIHRESEANIENKVDKIRILEDYIKDHGLEVPDCFEGEYADPERANIIAKRYPPYHSDEIGGISVPINLMSADEKIEELSQVIEEQKIHIETLEQERAELIDSKADFMSEKINEIVNREVNKELDRIKSSPDQLGLINIKENEDEDSDEFLIQTKDVLAVTQSMIKDLKMQNNENNEKTGSDIFYQMAKVDDGRIQNNGFEMMFSFENSKVILQFDQVTERVVALYQKVFDLIDTSKENQSMSYLSSGNPASTKSMNQERIYERKLPPNVEEMLKQKRQQLASQLSYQ